jgi:hypothetical protein
VRTNVSCAANYDRTPHEVPQTSLLAQSCIPLHIVFTKGLMLCHKPCQYQGANRLFTKRIVAQGFWSLSHRMRVDGLLGLNVLGQFRATFAFDRATFVLR